MQRVLIFFPLLNNEFKVGTFIGRFHTDGVESMGVEGLRVSGKVTRQCPQITTFEEKGSGAEADSNRGPSAYQPNA